MPPAAPAGPSRKKIFSTPTLLKLAGAFLAAFLLGGGGLYAYSLFTRPPADIAQRFVASFSKLETYHFDFTLSGSINESASSLLPFGQIALSALPMGSATNAVAASFHEGIGGISAEEQQRLQQEEVIADSDIAAAPIFSGTLMMKLAGDVRTTKGNEAVAVAPSFEFGDASSKLRAGGEIRFFGASKKLFAKIDRLEGLEGLLDLPSDIQGQWLAADEQTLAQMGVDLEELTKELPQQQEELSSEDKELEQDFEKAFANSFVLTYEGSEEVNGESAFHYKVVFDVSVFTTELLTLREKYHNRLDDPKLRLFKDLDEGSLDEFGRVLKRMEGDLFIAKRKLLPLKAMFVIELADADSGQTASLNVELAFSKFNEYIVIEEPQGAKNITEILEALGVAFPVPSDARRQADLAAFRVALELYKSDKGIYPSSQNKLQQGLPCDEMIDVYVTNCPVDPAGPPAFYGYRSDGRTYELTAALDDPECDVEGASREGGMCIFRVSSP